MLCKYCVRKDLLYSETGVPVPVYGIDVLTQTGSVYCSIPDIFLDKARAEALAARCNAGALDPIHLPDVVQDALAEI